MILLLACNTPAPATRAAAKTKSTWAPGDPIPGWEDADCPVTEGTDVLTVELPSVVSGSFRWYGSEGSLSRRWFGVAVADCVTVACEEGDTTPARTAFLWASIYDLVGTFEDRGAGPYELVGNDRYALTEGATAFFRWETWSTSSGSHNTAEGSVCLTQVRPDQVSGVLDITSEELDEARFPWTRDPHFVFPFTLPLVDHAGYVEAEGDGGLSPPEGAETGQFVYMDLDYDDAWPWDLITDATIRDEVYNRYVPWNTP